MALCLTWRAGRGWDQDCGDPGHLLVELAAYGRAQPRLLFIEHFGAGAGFWNVMCVYPDRGLGVVVMTNSTTSYDFEPRFTRLAGASWT